MRPKPCKYVPKKAAITTPGTASSKKGSKSRRLFELPATPVTTRVQDALQNNTPPVYARKSLPLACVETPEEQEVDEESPRSRRQRSMSLSEATEKVQKSPEHVQVLAQYIQAILADHQKSLSTNFSRLLNFLKSFIKISTFYLHAFFVLFLKG